MNHVRWAKLTTVQIGGWNIRRCPSKVFNVASESEGLTFWLGRFDAKPWIINFRYTEIKIRITFVLQSSLYVINDSFVRQLEPFLFVTTLRTAYYMVHI